MLDRGSRTRLAGGARPWPASRRNARLGPPSAPPPLRARARSLARAAPQAGWAVAAVYAVQLLIARPWDASPRTYEAVRSIPLPAFKLAAWFAWGAEQAAALKPAPFRVAEVATAYVQSEVLGVPQGGVGSTEEGGRPRLRRACARVVRARPRGVLAGPVGSRRWGPRPAARRNMHMRSRATGARGEAARELASGSRPALLPARASPPNTRPTHSAPSLAPARARAQVLFALVELGVPDLLARAAAPQTAEQLAAALDNGTQAWGSRRRSMGGSHTRAGSVGRVRAMPPRPPGSLAHEAAAGRRHAANQRGPPCPPSLPSWQINVEWLERVLLAAAAFGLLSRKRARPPPPGRAAPAALSGPQGDVEERGVPAVPKGERRGRSYDSAARGPLIAALRRQRPAFARHGRPGAHRF
jgi:hypothetical protein